MIFLTQIFVNKTEAARKNFKDAYAWHKAVWKSFSGQESKNRSFLFRIDDVLRDFKILLLSQIEPEKQGW